MEKVLVVGGAGYIGGAITDFLSEKKVDLLVYDSLVYERDFRKEVSFILGDIRDTEKLSKVIDDFKPTAIIWLAALVGDAACQVNPKLSLEMNQLSVKWLSENYDGRIIFTSTCSVYGKNDILLNEKSELNPLSIYAVTKMHAESYLKDKNAVIFRLGTLFGISDNFSRIRLDLVVNILSLKAAQGQALTVFGGDQWRPLLHVKDAAKAIASAAINLDNNIKPGIYNIAKRNMTIKEVAEAIKVASITDKEVKISYTEISFEDARNYRVSFDKYFAQKAAVSFDRDIEDGVKEIMTLILEGRIKDPQNPNFHNGNFLKNIYF